MKSTSTARKPKSQKAQNQKLKNQNTEKNRLLQVKQLNDILSAFLPIFPSIFYMDSFCYFRGGKLLPKKRGKNCSVCWADIAGEDVESQNENQINKIKKKNKKHRKKNEELLSKIEY